MESIGWSLLAVALLLWALVWLIRLPSRVLASARAKRERLRKVAAADARAANRKIVREAYPDHFFADELDERVAKVDRYLDHSYFDPPDVIVDLSGEKLRLYSKATVRAIERTDDHLVAKRRELAGQLWLERFEAAVDRAELEARRLADLDRQREEEGRTITIEDLKRRRRNS